MYSGLISRLSQRTGNRALELLPFGISCLRSCFTRISTMRFQTVFGLYDGIIVADAEFAFGSLYNY